MLRRWLGNPVSRWQRVNFLGVEDAAEKIGIPLERYVLIVNSNIDPKPDEIDRIAAVTGIPKKTLVAWVNRPRPARAVKGGQR